MLDMPTILYELSEDKKELLITDFYINEKMLKEYKKKYYYEGSEFWKLYQLESSVQLSEIPKVEKLRISHNPIDLETDDKLFLPKDYIRIIEKRIDTLYDKIRLDKLMKSYLNNDLKESIGLFSIQEENLETYKILSPGKVVSPFLFGGEIYYLENLLKVPGELQALDFYLDKNYEFLANSPYVNVMPWELFEEDTKRRVNYNELDKKMQEKTAQDLPHTTKLLKLYKTYKQKGK